MNDESGFTLIEVIAALAIVALLAMVVLPAIPRATSRERLAGLAVQVASLLKADRNAAMRNHSAITTVLDPDRHAIRSGATNTVLEFPADVSLEALLAQRCSGRRTGQTIDFFPSGSSCGGVILIARGEAGYQIRVNWLTGGVEIAARGGT